MVILSKIYTKTGDDGQTSNANNERVSKTSPIMEAIGAVDEANSAIGMATDEYNDIIERVQSDLFDLGAEIAGAVVRRAEREVWKIENVNPNIAKYLNRLSDLLFVMARYHNKGKEKLWVPNNG